MCPSMSGMRPNYICFSDPVSSPIHLFDVAQPKGASLKFSLYGITGNGRPSEVEGWKRGCCQWELGSVAQSTLVDSIAVPLFTNSTSEAETRTLFIL